MKRRNRRANTHMWNCPRCRRPFTRPHQNHSCGRASVSDFIEGKTPPQVKLYRRFEKLALAVGAVNLAPAKERIGFQHGRIFAAANGLSRNGLRIHIVTTAPIRSERVVRTEIMGPDCYVNHFLLRTVGDADDEMSQWLRQGYLWA